MKAACHCCGCPLPENDTGVRVIATLPGIEVMTTSRAEAYLRRAEATEAQLAQIRGRLLRIACDEYQASYGPQNGIVRVLHEFGVIDDATLERHLQPGPPDEREDDRAAVRTAARNALWKDEA